MNGEIIDGRSEPRGPAVACDMRLGAVRVTCAPHGLVTELEAGHTLADLARLARMCAAGETPE